MIVIEKIELLAWILSNMLFSYIDISLFEMLFKKQMNIKFKLKHTILVGAVKIIILKLLGYTYGACVNLILTILLIKVVLKEEDNKKCIKGGLISELPKILIDVSTVGFISINNLQANVTDYLISIYILNIVTKLILYHFKELVIIEKSKIQINALQAYNKNLADVNDSTREFRHNFSNFVQALEGYIVTDNMNGIKEMSSGLMKECVTTKNLAILDPKSVDNSAVYSIITHKYHLAEEQNIVMNIEFMINLKEMKICNYQLCKILSILLDNAIEAASKCNENKVINFKAVEQVQQKRKLIIIENSYSDINIDIDKIFEKGYSTKVDDDPEKHGIGLWSVKKILLHNENLNLYTQKGELFSQQLEIYE